MMLGALANIRDWFIIIWALLSIVATVFFILFVFTAWRGVKGLIGNVKLVVNEDIRPIIATGKESANNVTGTARFVSDTVVQPVIRAYGVINGVRRGAKVFTGGGKDKDKDKDKESIEDRRRRAHERGQVFTEGREEAR